MRWADGRQLGGAWQWQWQRLRSWTSLPLPLFLVRYYGIHTERRLAGTEQGQQIWQGQACDACTEERGAEVIQCHHLPLLG